jgi:hypothetical protein
MLPHYKKIPSAPNVKKVKTKKTIESMVDHYVEYTGDNKHFHSRSNSCLDIANYHTLPNQKQIICGIGIIMTQLMDIQKENVNIKNDDKKKEIFTTLQEQEKQLKKQEQEINDINHKLDQILLAVDNLQHSIHCLAHPTVNRPEKLKNNTYSMFSFDGYSNPNHANKKLSMMFQDNTAKTIHKKRSMSC